MTAPAATSSGGRATRAWLLALGLLPALLVAATYMRELRIGPLDWLWYVFLLVTAFTAVGRLRSARTRRTP